MRLIALLLLVCGLSVSARAADKIRLGLVPFSESLGAVLADKEGYFKDAGIEIETSMFNSGALALPLIQAGKLDATFTNTVSTIQVIDQGLDGAIIAPGAVVRDSAPDSTASLLVLRGGGITSPKDFIGKRIAVNVINSTTWLYVIAYLGENGVDTKQVKFVEVGFPQMIDPLLNKQLDGIAEVEPFRTVLLDGDKVTALAYPYVAVQPGGDISQYFASNDWVKKNPELAMRFAKAIVKGAAFANDPANAAMVRQVNMEFTHLNPALKDKVEIPKFGMAANPAEIQKTEDIMMKYGLLKKPVDMSGRILKIQ